jgi:hypothetical protein
MTGLKRNGSAVRLLCAVGVEKIEALARNAEQKLHVVRRSGRGGLDGFESIFFPA